ncbi:hypothetical protein [Sphingomonas sp.]|jgi:hypothetical protein|uniref:hypothetical protein n=1 Tax=Sphingomonas sp. TaxID=28214 RepID=UPI002ED94197
MLNIIHSLLLGAAFLATPAIATTRDDPDAELQKLLAGRSAGMPVSCIGQGSATNVTVIDGKALVYRVGSRLYVNTPDNAARLRDDDILVTRTFGSQVCSHDVVHLVDRGSQFPRGFVMLGKFVPYSKPAKAR